MSKKHRFEHVNYETEHQKYKHFVYRNYGSFMGEELEERFVLPYEDLESLHLSSATTSVPLKDNDFQIVQNYFLDYWTHVLSKTDIVVLQSLKRWAYGKKFVIMPISELAQRMNVSRNTLRKSIKVLEDNFFILQIHRTYAVGDEKKNNDAPAMFLLRDTIPLLDKWQVRQLPEFLRKEHDEYLNYMYETLTEQEGKGIRQLSMKSFLRDFLLLHAKPDGVVERKITKIINEHGFDNVVSSFFSIDKEANEYFKGLLGDMFFAKPSYDSYFKDAVFIFDEQLITIICKDEGIATAINNNALVEKALKQCIEAYSYATGYQNFDKEYIAKSFASYYVSKSAKDSF